MLAPIGGPTREIPRVAPPKFLMDADMNDHEVTLPSTKPYMLRALYEWCCDNGFTPYVSVVVDSHTVVPREHVRQGEIVLNIGPEATGRLRIDNEALQFSARFSGVVRDLWVPVGRIAAIYAKENGAGMGFEVEETADHPANDGAESVPSTDKATPEPSKTSGRPKLQVVK